MYQLGTLAKDNVTQLTGMLTHFACYQNGNQFYMFQPRGLNPKTGQPVKSLWITKDRVEGGVEVAKEDEIDLHLEVLGTEVEDLGTGFRGIATEVQLHTNGCLHFFVQPAGTQETGSPIESQHFDIRRLAGPAIPKLTPKEKVRSERERPSPMDCGSSTPCVE